MKKLKIEIEYIESKVKAIESKVFLIDKTNNEFNNKDRRDISNVNSSYHVSNNENEKKISDLSNSVEKTSDSDEVQKEN